MTDFNMRNKILKAILDGEQIQDKTDTGYVTISDAHAMLVLSRGGGTYLRVKPHEVVINGQTVPAPSAPDTEVDQFLVVIKMLDIDGVVISYAKFPYNERDGATRMFNALTRPITGW